MSEATAVAPPLCERDQQELLDLLVGAALIMRAELQGLARGFVYRREWHRRTEDLLARLGRPILPPLPPVQSHGDVPPPTPTTIQTHSHPAGRVVPFVSGRVSATVEELCGEGYDDYSPLPPGGSH